MPALRVGPVAPIQSSVYRLPSPASRSTVIWLWRREKSTMHESCPAWGGRTSVGITASAPGRLKSRSRAIGVSSTTSFACAQRGGRRSATSCVQRRRSKPGAGRVQASAHQRRVPSREATLPAVMASVNRGVRPGRGSAMTDDLHGRAAIVTGAASGIGRAVAERLVEGGAGVLAVDLEPDPDGPGEPYAADLTDAASNRDVVGAAVGRFGHLDTVIPNAGFQHVAPVAEFPTDRWDGLLALLLTSPFLLAKHAWNELARSGRGRFVCIASVHGLVASP